jgi:AAA+ superfamily predicted ATPase
MIEQTIPRPFFLNNGHTPSASGAQVSCHFQVDILEVAATALWHLWHDLDLGPNPLIFLGSRYSRSHRQHQAFFLNRIVERKEHILHWEHLTAPAHAHGIAQIPLAGPLLKADLIREASVYDRGTFVGSEAGWYRYDFREGWTALAVMLPPDADGDSYTITAIPDGRQDAWLAFLQALGELHDQMLHKERNGLIEVFGGSDELAEAIRATTFDDVILPSEILEQVAAQRRIFSPDLLGRYAAYRVPRLRKVLLAGPPGTGKTSLLKAEAALHARNGGYVIYVFAAKKEGRSWEWLSHAMESAARSRLPTLILCEDFEQFVSDAEDPQRVLNTLDGIATPDNVAGTLILATTNAPEQIDPRIKDRPGRIDMVIEIGPVEREALVIRFLQRFLGAAYSEQEHAPFAPELLKQTGSHIREVCLLAAIHSLEEDREVIVRGDLAWAHETILHGRAIAAQPERFVPPPPKKLFSVGFGKR